MKNAFRATASITWSFFTVLCYSSKADAQVYGEGSPNIQSALILSLALTSLLLFCIYLFQKHKTEKKKAPHQARWTTEDNPLQTRLYETHKALNTLLDQPGIPMAKTALEQGRIMDATPSLYRTLGYSKRDFLKQGPESAGLLPTGEDDIRRLIENGWTESRVELCQKATGVRFDCRILNIATHLDGHPTVLSIIPDLAENCPANQTMNPTPYVENLHKNR